jgi:signal transduction histidine kinase/ligand-binding sensor domain-containing protein/CheY-like chemotaxis protein
VLSTVCVLLACTAQTLAASAFKADGWTVEQGLPQNTVTGVAQDRDGFLWVATRKGLARFDGLVFWTVGVVDGIDLSTLRLTGVATDDDGSVWIGTYGMGLLRLRDGHLRQYGPEQGVPDAIVWELTRDRLGRLWVATSGGARYLSGDAWQSLPLPSHIAQESANTVFRDRRGHIWIGTSTLGALRVDGREIEMFGQAEGLPVARVFSFAEDGNGVIWAATPQGLARLDDKTRRFVAFEPLSGVGTHHLRIDHEGALWIATSGEGLWRYRGQTLERFAQREGVTSDFVLSVFEDREGSVWVGTVSGGLNRLSRVRRQLLDTRTGLPPFQVTTVYQDPRGTFWAGTLGGGLVQIDGEHIRRHTTANGLPSDRITSVATAGDGAAHLWVGTDGAGAFRLRNGRLVEHLTPDVVGRTVRVIEHGGDRTYFGGQGLLVRDRQGAERRWTRAEGLGADEVRALYLDLRDRLWIGTYGGGLSRLDPDGTLTSWGLAEGLTNLFVTAIHVDASEAVWVGTHGGGLFRLAGGTLSNVSESQGLEDSVVFDIMEDHAERLWLMMNAGVRVLSLADAHAVADGRQETLPSTLVGASEGVRGIDGTDGNQPQSWLAADGRLWLASTAGLIIIDPADVGDADLPPTPLIDVVTVNARPVDLGSLDDSLAGRNIDIDFSAAQLRNAAHVRYQYRLVGFDEAWSTPRDARRASFTNLRPGTYRFEVRSQASGSGPFGRAATLSFTIAPHLFETPWFLGLVLVALAGAGVAVHRVRIVRMQRREAHLQQLVDTRTAALRHEMAERERADEERRVLDERMQQAHRLESLGVLAGGIAHDFNNLLVGVLGEAGLALTTLPHDSPTRLHLQRIEHAALRAGELTSQMLAFSGRSRFVSVPIDLAEIVRDTARLLSTVLGRQVALETDFPVTLPAILGDPSQIRQVVMNLLTNASDAIGDRPGRILVAAGVQVLDAAMARASEAEAEGPLAPGPYIWLTVEDDGVGMGPETLARIFEPFFTTKFTGRGLGLAAVQGIIRSHGGRIHVRSGRDAGTVFSILLPASTHRSATRPADEVHDIGQALPVRPVHDAASVVLVVDDEPTVRQVAQVTLAMAGYRVETVGTGEEALDRFGAAPDAFRAVLLDLTLPGLSGRGVLRAIRGIRPHTPVLMTSGFAAEEVADLATEPATAFLAKPWRPKELTAALQRLVASAADLRG